MGDQLEKYIQSNRGKFDEESDKEALWSRIEHDLDKSASRVNLNWVWKAAAVLFMAATLLLSLDRLDSNQETLVENNMDQEFVKVEAFYTNLIEQKRQELKQIDRVGLSENFLKELDELDSTYKNLKNTYKTNISQEKILNAMIENLQLRIQILNKQLEILQALNEKENEIIS